MITQSTVLETRIDEVKAMIEKKAKVRRNLLEEQYELVFGELERLPTKSITSQPATRGPRGLYEANH
jgi:hypothetical protein